MTNSGNGINRATGLLIIEVRNSNPNGDPDREGEPRQRPHDQRGEISPVSFKRKLRHLVDDKETSVWSLLDVPKESWNSFNILESRGRDRKQIESEIKSGKFQEKYWDGRLFGNTFLEKDGEDSIRTGVAQFTLGISVAPVRIERFTQTHMAGVQAGRSRGMAPLGYRIVEHGVYCMPFFINPTAATKTGCTKDDVDLLLKLIPLAYPHTASAVRPCVEIRHAWYAEHKSPLGSCSDFAIIDALTPEKRANPEQPSTSWPEYDVPQDLGVLRERVASFVDLVTPA